MITFSEVTNSLEVTFLSRIIISLAKIVYSIGDIYTYVGNTCITSTSIKGAYIRANCIGDTLTYANGTCIEAWDTDIRDDFIKDTCVGYTGGVSTVKPLGIYLQLSRILKLRQYSPILETGIRAGQYSLHLH